MKSKTFNHIENLKNAFVQAGIGATITERTFYCEDFKSRVAIELEVNIKDTDGYNWEIHFHPETGRRVDSITQCPVVRKK